MSTPPRLASMLSQPITANNFLAMQSALLSPGTASLSVTFTNIPSTNRVTYEICNTGSKAAYICGSNSSSITPAVLSTSSPAPTSTLLSTSTCLCIPNGAILTRDFVGGTNTISAIVNSGTTTLEISVGGGQ